MTRSLPSGCMNRVRNFPKDVDASTSPLLSLLITGLLPMLIFIGLGQYMAKKKLRDQMGGKDSLMFGGMGKSNAKIYVQSTKGYPL